MLWAGLIYQAEPPGRRFSGRKRMHLLFASEQFLSVGFHEPRGLIFMSDSAEAVLADVPVTASLALSSERLRMFFTQKRIILAHIGKRGVASPALASFFGRLSGALEDLFKSGKESVAKRGLKGASPDQILALDKDNFSINYDDVVTVEVSGFGTLYRIVMVTKDEKLRFTTRASPEFLKLLTQYLGEKVKAD